MRRMVLVFRCVPGRLGRIVIRSLVEGLFLFTLNIRIRFRLLGSVQLWIWCTFTMWASRILAGLRLGIDRATGFNLWTRRLVGIGSWL